MARVDGREWDNTKRDPQHYTVQKTNIPLCHQHFSHYGCTLLIRGRARKIAAQVIVLRLIIVIRDPPDIAAQVVYKSVRLSHKRSQCEFLYMPPAPKKLNCAPSCSLIDECKAELRGEGAMLGVQQH